MKKLCISTILVVFGLVQAGEVLASTKPAVSSTLGDVTMPLPKHDSDFILSGCANDSTYTCTPGAPAAIARENPPGSGAAGDSVHTLEESDAYTDANGVAHPASWSPSFVTGADASDMTMTFYNVKPLQGILIQYGGNQYDRAPPHINELFVVQVVDIKSGATDKSYIVYPFQSVVYQMAGAFKYQDASQIAGLFETYTGRKTSYNTSNHSHPSRTAFFTPEQDVNNDLHDGPQVNGSPIGVCDGCNSSNHLINYTQNGFFPFTGGPLGYGFMPRMFQSQDPSFTFSMNLGPMPALKRIQVDSYWVMTRQDDPTLTAAPYQTCAGGNINCQTTLVANKSGSYRYNPGAHPVDFFYTFGPTSGSASGYTRPSSTNPTKLDPTAFKIAVSDAPDNPYLGTPAQTVPAGDPSTGDGCSTVSVDVPAMYVGVNSGPLTVLVPPSASAADQTHWTQCTAIGYAVSIMTGYTANTSKLVMQYSSAPSATVYCPDCTVTVTSASHNASNESTRFVNANSDGFNQTILDPVWTGTITGGAQNVPVCTLSLDGSQVSGSPFPVNGSDQLTTLDYGNSGSTYNHELTLHCATNKGTSEAKWKYASTANGICETSTIGTPTAPEPAQPPTPSFDFGTWKYVCK